MSSAGRRNRRVEILAATTATDHQGGQTVTWATSEELWAEVVPFSVREVMQAGALQTAVPTLARVPYRASLSVTSRLRDTETGTSYEILSVRDLDGRRVMLELELMEVT